MKHTNRSQEAALPLSHLLSICMSVQGFVHLLHLRMLHDEPVLSGSAKVRTIRSTGTNEAILFKEGHSI
jgi:hypothetical protein